MGFWDYDYQQQKFMKSWSRARQEAIPSHIGKVLTHPDFPGWEVEVVDYNQTQMRFDYIARHPDYPTVRTWGSHPTDPDFPEKNLEYFIENFEKVKHLNLPEYTVGYYWVTNEITFYNLPRI